MDSNGQLTFGTYQKKMLIVILSSFIAGALLSFMCAIIFWNIYVRIPAPPSDRFTYSNTEK